MRGAPCAWPAIRTPPHLRSAVWQETPPVPAIGRPLRATGRDFYGVPIGGPTSPISSTAPPTRQPAAGLATHWRDAAVTRETGGKLSPRRCSRRPCVWPSPACSPTGAGLAALAPRLESAGRQVWPRGLASPTRTCPIATPGRPGDPTAQNTRRRRRRRFPRLASLPHIPARFEPLIHGRPGIWHAPDKARLFEWPRRPVADADLDALDQALAKRHGKGRTHRPGLPDAPSGGRRSFQCQGRSCVGGCLLEHAWRPPARRLDSSRCPGAARGDRPAEGAYGFRRHLIGHLVGHTPAAPRPAPCPPGDGRRLAQLTIAAGRSSLTLVDDSRR